MYMCICMSGYAFRHALRYRAESWHGGRGWAHKVCGYFFKVTLPGVKGHPGVNLLHLKIQRRDGFEFSTNLEVGEFKFSFDGCITRGKFDPRSCLFQVLDVV